MSRSDWIRRVDPPVPGGFVPWLGLPSSDTGPAGVGGRVSDRSAGLLPDPEELLAAAIDALGRALEPEGRERRGAFDLLAADAFATWAAEAALDGPGVERQLEWLRDRLAGESGAG